MKKLTFRIECFSVGIASFPEHNTEIYALLKMADSAMYITKKAGKNQTVIY